MGNALFFLIKMNEKKEIGTISCLAVNNSPDFGI